MALWTMVDEDAGKPKYLSESEKQNVIGISVTESLDADSKSKGLTTPGWVSYKTYTDAQGNVRHKSEVLVAASSIGADSETNTLNDDLGIVTLNVDYPIPGSGTYRTAAQALLGISFSTLGTPAAATGEVTTVADSEPGLWRSKYTGNFAPTAMSTVSTYNLSFLNGLTPMKSIPDTNLSWGFQIDGPNEGESSFSIEWKGYIKVPTSQNWNFYLESDDTAAVWIGSEAVTGFNSSNCLLSSANKSLPGQETSSRSSKSLTMDNTKYYPIRIWYSEFLGGCKFQLYALGEDGTKLNGQQMDLVYNNTTKGYNP